MQFKKSAFVAIAIVASLIMGCDSGQKIDLKRDMKISATLWNSQGTLIGKDLTVQTGTPGSEKDDISTENALKKYECNLAVEQTLDEKTHQYVTGPAKLACAKDIVEIPAVLIDNDGKADVPALAVDQRISVKLTESTEVKIK